MEEINKCLLQVLLLRDIELQTEDNFGKKVNQSLEILQRGDHKFSWERNIQNRWIGSQRRLKRRRGMSCSVH